MKIAGSGSIGGESILGGARSMARSHFGKGISGGSTLTMQVARLLDPHPKHLAAKFASSGARCNWSGIC